MSFRFTNMTMKIAVSPEYDKRHFHSNRLFLILLQKELNALNDTLFTF